LRLLAYLGIATLLIAILSIGHVVLVPLAVAVMLGFILTPPVTALERRGLPRFVCIGLVLLTVLGLLGGFGYVLSRQFNDFAAHMPQYSRSIKDKLATLRATGKPIGQIQDTVEKVSRELDKQEGATRPSTGEPAGKDAVVQPVTVVPSVPNDVERLRMLLEPILGPIVDAGLVLILTTFMLMQREDIRNRLIRLGGLGRVTVTTRTLDEAGHRISKYLFTQSLINATFGVCVALGLRVIGVPFPLLWGVEAALLRFVPYLGSALALLMPTALAFVGSPGWGPTIETVVLFVALDAFAGNIVEPVVIGTHTGISSLALLVSAMFWTWLWGLVGLVLSTPLTVCLAAVGKHVPGMEFLSVVLGDEPPLEADVTLYQRLLAGDEDEASAIIEQELTEDHRAAVFDRVVVPTLAQAGRDQLSDDISSGEYQLVVGTLTDLLRHRAELADPDPPDRSVEQKKILGVPARNESDELALEMLRQLLDGGWMVEMLTTATLASEVLLAIEQTAPDVICIAAIPPGGVTHIRYLCKRIHGQFPGVPIWVLRPEMRSGPLKIVEQLTSDGAQQVATSFTTAAAQLTQFVFPTADQVAAGSESNAQLFGHDTAAPGVD